MNPNINPISNPKIIQKSTPTKINNHILKTQNHFSFKIFIISENLANIINLINLNLDFLQRSNS